MEKLSQVLWRERELLESLQYSLEVEQLILASGRSRWLLRATEDVEAVLEDLRRTEILRAAVADEAAAAVGLPPNPSLRELVERASAPWDEILGDHRRALVTTSEEIVALADANRDLITNGYRSARETLLALGESVQSYDAAGGAVTDAASPTRVDRSI